MRSPIRAFVDAVAARVVNFGRTSIFDAREAQFVHAVPPQFAWTLGDVREVARTAQGHVVTNEDGDEEHVEVLGRDEYSFAVLVWAKTIDDAHVMRLALITAIRELGGPYTIGPMRRTPRPKGINLGVTMLLEGAVQIYAPAIDLPGTPPTVEDGTYAEPATDAEPTTEPLVQAEDWDLAPSSTAAPDDGVLEGGEPA